MHFFKSCYGTLAATEVAEVTDVHSHTYTPRPCAHEANLIVMNGLKEVYRNLNTYRFSHSLQHGKKRET